MPQDDPDELFDVCDAEGRPLGHSKPRQVVHRDGDWHRSVHVWVVLACEAVPTVVLQRRSLTKDTHPGKVDVSVAGHVKAGETVADALRETEEEIGLAVSLADVARLGIRRQAHVREGYADREVQEVFLVVTARTLESLRPDPEEVLGLLAVPLDTALGLVVGQREEVAARELRAGESEARDVVLCRDELLLAPDGCFAIALRSIARRIAGHADPEWRVG